MLRENRKKKNERAFVGIIFVNILHLVNAQYTDIDKCLAMLNFP